jgi:Tol biopolymer transport system component/DNA-binding winged helix-turn-helix (wHTH) protein
VLLSLLERAGDAVTREELRQRVWASDTFVDFEHGLNTAIKELRAVLNDSATQPKYVETLPKLGYRIIVAVKAETAADQAANPLVLMEVAGSALEEVRGANHQSTQHPELAQGVISLQIPISKQRKKWLYAAIATIVVAALGAGTWLRKHTPVDTRTSHQKQLTAQTDENPVLSAAISRDGRFVAYSLKEAIYLQEIGKGETHKLPETAGFSVADWFPDSTHILANNEQGLWKISLIAGEKEKVASNVFSAAISPDGSQILFRREFPTRTLWIMSASGRGPKQILNLPANEGIGSGAWSPDGKRVAFVHRSAQWKFFLDVFEVETGSWKAGVLEDDSLRAAVGSQMVWLLGGKLVLSLKSMEDNSPNRSNLAWIPVDEGGMPTGKPVRITSSTDSAIQQVSAASDGSRMVATIARAPFALFVADLDLATARVRNPVRISNDNWNNYAIGWAPDGNELFYESPGPYTPHILKAKLKERETVTVLSGGPAFWGSVLTRDGSWLLYFTQENKGPRPSLRHLVRRPTGGGPEELVFSSETIYSIRCPSSRLQPCVWSEGDRKEVRFSTFNPQEGKLQELLKVPLKTKRAWLWDISPDGSTFALFAYGENEIHIIDWKSRSTKILDARPFLINVQSVHWTSDGKYLLASGNGVNQARIIEIDLEGRARLLIENQNGWITAPTPSEDGKRLAYTSEIVESNITLFENF